MELGNPANPRESKCGNGEEKGKDHQSDFSNFLTDCLPLAFPSSEMPWAMMGEAGEFPWWTEINNKGHEQTQHIQKPCMWSQVPAETCVSCPHNSP